MSKKMTKAQFARECMYIACCASDWASYELDNLDDCDEEIKTEMVACFTSLIRRELDLLDTWGSEEVQK